jgi:hypothetical protein
MSSKAYEYTMIYVPMKWENWLLVTYESFEFEE